MNTEIDGFDKISFHYVRIGDGSITIGYMPDTNRKDKLRKFVYGIAYCNYQGGDTFLKKTGRDKARGRVLQEWHNSKQKNYSGVETFTFDKNAGGFYHQINEIVEKKALYNKNAPRWVKDFVNKGKIPTAK